MGRNIPQGWCASGVVSLVGNLELSREFGGVVPSPLRGWRLTLVRVPQDFVRCGGLHPPTPESKDRSPGTPVWAIFVASLRDAFPRRLSRGHPVLTPLHGIPLRRTPSFRPGPGLFSRHPSGMIRATSRGLKPDTWRSNEATCSARLKPCPSYKTSVITRHASIGPFRKPGSCAWLRNQLKLDQAGG
jgi:hypothetical protein